MNNSNTSDRREAQTRARALLIRFGKDNLRKMFIGRRHDNLFSFVAEPISVPGRPEHFGVWLGFSITIDDRYSPFNNPGEQMMTDDN